MRILSFTVLEPRRALAVMRAEPSGAPELIAALEIPPACVRTVGDGAILSGGPPTDACEAEAAEALERRGDGLPSPCDFMLRLLVFLDNGEGLASLRLALLSSNHGCTARDMGGFRVPTLATWFTLRQRLCCCHMNSVAVSAISPFKSPTNFEESCSNIIFQLFNAHYTT